MVEQVLSIIDDYCPIRTALRRLMLTAKYRAITFDTAESFLASPQAEGSSCIITDIQLPGLSGFGLVAALGKRRVRTPVIMITARADPDLERRAAAAGAICLLRKPLRADRLLHEITMALSSYQFNERSRRMD